jgi:CAAX protease family protein
MHLTPLPWDFYLILAALGTLVPWRGAVRVRRLLREPAPRSPERLSLYSSTIAYQWLIAAVVAWRASSAKVSLADLGVAVSDLPRTAWIAAVLTVLLGLNQWASLRRMARVPNTRSELLFQLAEKIMPRTSTDKIVFAVLACTAGMTEEFLYRGFVFAAFAHTFAGSAISLLIAAALSSAWFGIGHLYQGKRGVITTFVVGILFASVRIWSGSLIPSISAHAGIDLIAGMCMPSLLPDG